MVGCRSSGLLDSSAQVVTGKCKLISIHATSVGGPATIKVFDGTDNTGKEVARITVGVEHQTGGTPPTYNQDETVEFDMHGVLIETGIYYEETSGNAAVFINFA
jgi:hypothetical protein|tara:strand:- start:129 stop:440 length:312 start_codon:yes stop_codon:yes gene_type:complete